MLPLLLFSFLPFASSQSSSTPAPPAASVGLFATCSAGQRCEGTAVCRFNICLPPTNPIPVYAHGNRTFTLQHRINVVTQSPKVVQAGKIVALHPNNRATITVKVPTCQPTCLGTARCVHGACRCIQIGVVYSAVTGCVAPPPGSRPIAAVPVPPVPAFQAIPQILPGEKCAPGTECTGGSTCNVGICTCPPELVQQGGVCVSPAVMGLPHRGLPGY